MSNQNSIVKWHINNFVAERGILVAADQNAEWMLPWWWVHYNAYNSYPVTFIDFGMSQAAIKWCERHGQVIPFTVPFDFLIPPNQIDPQLIEKWMSLFLTKDFWNARVIWFKKPFAMLQTPYQHTLWLDLDCEVKNSLIPLFDMCQTYPFSIVPEPDFSIKNFTDKRLIQPGQTLYNAGVILFDRSSCLPQWAQSIIDYNAQFAGDSDLLTYLINRDKLKVHELSQIYNWRMAQGTNSEAIIIHWVADWGKKYIHESLQLMAQMNLFN